MSDVSTDGLCTYISAAVRTSSPASPGRSQSSAFWTMKTVVLRPFAFGSVTYE
jgi:hypothetical protein